MFHDWKQTVAFLLAVLMAGVLTACSTQPKPQRLALLDAQELIKAKVLKDFPNYNRDALNAITETDLGIDKLFEKTDTQYYNLRQYIYAIYEGKVSGIFSLELICAATADLDGNGHDETMSALAATSFLSAL